MFRTCWLKASCLRSCVILLFTITFGSAFAQTNPDSYEITAEPQSMDVATAVSAIEAANWDTYRFETKRRTITFACGMQIELLSAAELKANVLTYNKDVIIPDNLEITTKPLFKILSTGQITATYDVKTTK